MRRARLLARPADVHIEREVAGTEREPLDARRRARDRRCVRKASARLDQRHELDRCRAKTVLALDLRHEPIGDLDVFGPSHLRQHDAVEAAHDDRSQVAVTELAR
jgi:hypothetical protein